jgi:hypothetical protein
MNTLFLKNFLLGTVAHAYNLSTRKAEQEDHKVEAFLGYIVRYCL